MKDASKIFSLGKDGIDLSSTDMAKLGVEQV